jgi:NSS family neurotransmitter:Na+ symporter
MVLVAGVVPLALIYMVSNEFISKISTTYEGYPEWFVGLFGWGMAGGLVVLALVLTFIPWSRTSKAHHDPEYQSMMDEEAEETAR